MLMTCRQQLLHVILL